MKTTIFKISLVLSLTLFFYQAGFSQVITIADKRKLILKEDSLRNYAKDLNIDSTTADRMIADSVFTRILVRALQVKNSFYYPFDSLKGVSKLYAPDSTFRIYTWNVQFNDYWSHQKGAIQMRTRDGSLKLIPLNDYSEFTKNADDSVRNTSHWIGAIYYNVIKTEYQGKNYYTLFGFDTYSAQSSKKWIEVMYFNGNGAPVFGGPFFTFQHDTPPQQPKYRISVEFKKDTRVLVNYIDDLGMILVDHLVSETDEPENKWTYVPDGDDEAYKWENGKWVHQDKAFDYKVDMRGADPLMGRPPMGDPILDAKGNHDEKKLEEKSQQNKEKEGTKPPQHDE